MNEFDKELQDLLDQMTRTVGGITESITLDGLLCELYELCTPEIRRSFSESDAVKELRRVVAEEGEVGEDEIPSEA